LLLSHDSRGFSRLEVATLELRRAEDIAPAFEALKGRVEQPSVAVRVHI